LYFAAFFRGACVYHAQFFVASYHDITPRTSVAGGTDGWSATTTGNGAGSAAVATCGEISIVTKTNDARKDLRLFTFPKPINKLIKV
jgi:hypothetical protein